MAGVGPRKARNDLLGPLAVSFGVGSASLPIENPMRVILVHGLGRTRLSLVLLARRLSMSRHTPEFFSYSAMSESHEDIVARLTTRLRSLATLGYEVGLVGHSFGGLLLREAVAAVLELRVKHVVMLGTPNRQPRLAVRVYTRLPFRLLRGACGHRLADPSWFRSLPMLSTPYTIVAGTAGWRRPLSPFADGPNDGAVAVSETLMSDNDRPVLMPVIHTFMMNSRSVHRLILEKLAAQTT